MFPKGLYGPVQQQGCWIQMRAECGYLNADILPFLDSIFDWQWLVLMGSLYRDAATACWHEFMDKCWTTMIFWIHDGHTSHEALLKSRRWQPQATNKASRDAAAWLDDIKQLVETSVKTF